MARVAFKPEELPLVATLLLDAALADGHMGGDEAETIKHALREASGLPRLPAEVADALRAYDPARFDLEEACRALHLDTRHKKRELLDLVRAVVTADGALEASEAAWIDRLAQAIGRHDTQMTRFRADLAAALDSPGHDDAQ